MKLSYQEKFIEELSRVVTN
ncbi:hypothetical protein [Bartonella grahamii]|nr:hypothetical protein [Bartonella grahamii]